MPELPEAETWRQLADQTAVGRKITAVKTAEDSIIFDQNDPKAVAKALKNLSVTGTRRHGKHVWLTFDQPGHLYLHFGMSGSLWALAPGEEAPSHIKLELQLDNDMRLVYRNLRRIGKIRWLDDVTAVPPVSKLGPDPLSDAFTCPNLQNLLSKRKAPIKAVLLDQAVFAGVGNWIADEVLYQSNISPHRPCSSLTSKEVQTLHRTLLRILKKAVAVDADASRFPKTWLFHHRWGKKAETTSIGETLQFDQVGGRTTAWVPERQG
jgi:formamidopyrimidine-DNA glycosylase